jgi:hypothetical protein
VAISNDLLSSTLYSIRDNFVDELFKKTAFLDNAKKQGGIEYEDGGIKVQRPLNIVEHSSITELPTGYEPVNIAVNDVLRPAVYDWTDFVAPIAISKKEELENSGEKAIVKIVESRTKNVFGLLRREANKQILAGTSTALPSLGSLNGVVLTTGFFENLAPGSQTNTVGGVSKTTFQSTKGWQNQRQTAASSFSGNGLAAMDLIYISANEVAPMGGISLIIASIAAMANYKRQLFANERYVDPKVLDGGRMALAYAGAMMEQDSDMPTNAGVGTDECSMYFLNFDGVKLVIHEDADFAVLPFVDGQGTTARIAHIYSKMSLVADHLGSCGVLIDGDTY